jgi:hypothetical protein
MGWGLRLLALFAGLIALDLGAWPLTLLAAMYLALSFRKPKTTRAPPLGQQVLSKPRRPLKRYALGGVLLLVSGTALGSGGTFSPVVFLLGGLAVIFLPYLRGCLPANQVVPMRGSILLRSRFFPMRWHALAEVKLESNGQTRGIAAMEGQLIVFAGRNPATFQVVSAYAFGHRQAEAKVVRTLRRETRMLSQRGAHILPLDSADAAAMLSLELERLDAGTDSLEALSSLPFEVIALRVKDGLVASHRAFNIAEAGNSVPAIPSPDLSLEREPLLAEVVREVEDRHGWPAPDEYSPFLAAMDASRSEPLADRLRPKGEAGGKLAIETPGGAEVRLTRAQLRAVARIYA